MKFKTKPYEHQVAAFERCKDEKFYALFMDMGTGKTKITIDAAAYKFETKQIEAVLIIAPNNVHSQWIEEEIPAHCPVPYKTFIWKSSKINGMFYQRKLESFLSIKDNKNLRFFAVNVEAFQSSSILKYIALYVKKNNVLIVVDESTRIKTPTAKRSKNIHRLNKYGQRMILTGTPTAKSPLDLWSMFEFLKNNFFGVNYFIFQHRYGVMVKGTNHITGKSYNTLIDEKTFNIAKSKINKLKINRMVEKLCDADIEALSSILGMSEKNVKFIESTEKFSKFKRIDELKSIINPYVFSIKKTDCLDLPDKVYEPMFITMDKEQKRIYKNLKTQLIAEYDDQELTVFNKVALTTRLMQICGGFFPYKDEEGNKKVKRIGKSNVKLERIKEDIEEVSDEIRIIIWANFVLEIELIYNELSKLYTCCKYYGKTEQDEREQIKKDFREGKYKIFIGNTSVAGFGLNLQNATLQYYFSNNFSVENRLQAEDRSHRIGVKSTCVYKDIICKGTIDEKVFKAIKEGRNLNDYFKTNSLKEILQDEDEK